MPGNNICGYVNPKHLIQMFHCSMEECGSAAAKYIVYSVYVHRVHQNQIRTRIVYW